MTPKKTYKCIVCDGLVDADRYEYDAYGELEYWHCNHCKSDRIGCWRLNRMGFDPAYIHHQLNGRPSYAGINMDTYELVIDTYRRIKLLR